MRDPQPGGVQDQGSGDRGSPRSDPTSVLSLLPNHARTSPASARHARRSDRRKSCGEPPGAKQIKTACGHSACACTLPHQIRLHVGTVHAHALYRIRSDCMWAQCMRPSACTSPNLTQSHPISPKYVLSHPTSPRRSRHDSASRTPSS